MATKNPHGEGGPDLLVGVDGIPRWRLKDDPAAERAELERVMRIFEAQWQAGDRRAVSDAVRALWRRGMAQSWLADATDKLTKDATKEQEKRDRRAFAGHVGKWEEVIELLERGDELHARFKDDRGTSVARAQAAVSEALTSEARKKKKKTRGYSEGNIKTSYDIIEAAGGKHATFESYKAVVRERARKKKGQQLDSSRGN
jgi:hypothetical protein